MDDSLFIDDDKQELDQSLFIDDETETPEQRLERIKAEPGIQDTTVDDVMTVQGLGSLASLAAKGGANLLAKNAPKYLDDIATKAFNSQMGATLKQGRQIGEEAADDVAKYGYEHGYMNLLRGQEGAKDLAKQGLKETGKEISVARKAGGNVPRQEIVDRLQSDIGSNLEKGVRRAEMPGYEMAVEEVSKLGPKTTTSRMADKATFLNKYAKKNADALGQTKNPMTDVANSLSRMSNEIISQKLGPEKAAEYLAKLDEYQKLKAIQAYLKQGSLRSKFSKGDINMLKGAKDTIMGMGPNKIVGQVAHYGSKGINALRNASPNVPKAAASLAAWLKEHEK